MRLNILLSLSAKNGQTLLNRRLQRTELGSIRLYLNQMNQVLDDSNELNIKEDYSAKTILSYLNKLFKIYKRSISKDTINLDLTLEKWKSNLTKTHAKEVSLILKNINKNENYRLIHLYLEENIENLDKIFTMKELVRLFQILIHLDKSQEISKTTLKLFEYHMSGDLSRYDLFDILVLQNGYGKEIFFQQNFKIRTADLVYKQLFNNVNPVMNEHDLGIFSINNDDNNYLLTKYDTENDFQYIKSKILIKYLRFFNTSSMTNIEKFFENTIELITKNKNSKNTFYFMNVFSSLVLLNNMVYNHFKLSKKNIYSNIVKDYLKQNKEYIFENFHNMYNFDGFTKIIFCLNEDIVSLADISFLIEKINKIFQDEDVEKNINPHEFFSILSAYDYLI